MNYKVLTCVQICLLNPSSVSPWKGYPACGVGPKILPYDPLNPHSRPGFEKESPISRDSWGAIGHAPSPRMNGGSAVSACAWL
jgi:hypothetical protein